MANQTKFSPEVRERAVRMVHESREHYASLWKAVESIAPKIGCNPVTLLQWVKRAEIDSGQRPGATCTMRTRFVAQQRDPSRAPAWRKRRSGSMS